METEDTISQRNRWGKRRRKTARQKPARCSKSFAAPCRIRSQKLAVNGRSLPPAVAGICRQLPPPNRQFCLTLTLNYSLAPFFPMALFSPLMTEPGQPKRGGKAFHSILEPHFDFIRQQRQRRKTWQEIADLLLVEKGIRVTFYAPYRFYQRKLKRMARPHWEDMAANPHPAPKQQPPNRPPSKPAPLPTSSDFKRPDKANLNNDQFT